MDPITAAFIVSTGVSMMGTLMGNNAKARQERANAAYYKKQAAYARLAAERQHQLAEFEYTEKLGKQASTYAGSGVALEGSAAVTMGGTLKNFIDEAYAIKRKGELEYELASMRGVQSSQEANMLSSPAYNLLQVGAQGLNAYASIAGA